MKPKNLPYFVPSIILTVSAVLSTVTAVRADQTWTGATDAAWATLTNWSGGAIPLTTENAVFDATSTTNLTAIALGANRTVNGITFTSPASDVTIIAGSTGSLTKSGLGSLTLSADNNYTGGTTVNAGTLLAQAPNSSTGSGSVLVNTGATLGGSGKVAGVVTVASGGGIAPGTSVQRNCGVLSVKPAPELGASSRSIFHVPASAVRLVALGFLNAPSR